MIARGAVTGTRPAPRLHRPVPSLRWREVFRRAFGVDVRGLAAARIALAFLLLVDLGNRARFLTAFHTDLGAVPREAVRRAAGEAWVASLHMMNGSVAWAASLLVLHVLAAIALLLGWHARAASLAAFVLTASLHARNPLILHAGDQMLRLALFWGMLVPWGAAWSLDARRLRGRATGSADLPVSGWVASPGTAGFLLQMAFVYWFTALLKVSPSWLGEGNAVLLALNLDAFATPLGVAMRELPHDLLRFLTWGTFALEVAGPFLIFLSLGGRLRVLAFVLFAAMHLAFGSALELGTFRWIPIAIWLVVLPGWFWDRLMGAAHVPNGQVEAPPSGTDHPRAGTKLLPARLAAPLPIAAILLVWWQNVGTIVSAAAPPAKVTAALRAAGVSQRWGMFAPFPGVTDGWMVARGRWADGRTADLLRDGRAITWEKPRSVAGELATSNWRKYFVDLSAPKGAVYRAYFDRYLCRTGGRHGPSRGVTGPLPEMVELFWILELTFHDGRVSDPVPLMLDVRSCGDSLVTPAVVPSPPWPALSPAP